MNTKLLLGTLCIISSYFATSANSTPLSSQTYEFYGKHFIASYKNCDSDALQDIDSLIKALEEAVQTSGATILKYNYETFPGNGLTAFFVLSESHASIHTYPEHNSCFVDLFTCGHRCSYEKFDEVLEKYLKPMDVEKKVYIRT